MQSHPRRQESLNMSVNNLFTYKEKEFGWEYEYVFIVILYMLLFVILHDLRAANLICHDVHIFSFRVSTACFF